MKRYIILFAILAIALTSCGKEVLPSENSALTNDKTQNGISVNSVTNFLHSDNEENVSYDRVNISCHYTSEGIIYFVELTEQTSWWTELYLIEQEGGKITRLIDMQVGGFTRFFDFEIIEIEKALYIAAFSATHMGNGGLEIVPLSGDGQTYSIPCIDAHYEENTLTASENGIIEENAVASSVFLGGKLQPLFQDYDGDGNVDIVLEGIEHIYSGNYSESCELERVYYIKKVYLYDVDAVDFICASSVRTTLN